MASNSGVATGWTGVATPLLLVVAPEIDTNSTSFYWGRSTGQGGVGPVAPPPDSRYRHALAMSVHPTYFDLVTPLDCKYVRTRNHPRERNARLRRVTALQYPSFLSKSRVLDKVSYRTRPNVV